MICRTTNSLDSRRMSLNPSSVVPWASTEAVTPEAGVACAATGSSPKPAPHRAIAAIFLTLIMNSILPSVVPSVHLETAVTSQSPTNSLWRLPTRLYSRAMETRLPPGPPLPLWVQTPLLWLGIQPYLDACHRRYGRAFTVRAAPLGEVVHITDPADVKTVFAGDPAVYHAGEANTLIGDLIGPSSVILLDEAQHRRRRTLMTPPFHGKSVRRQSEVMAEVAVAEAGSWPIGRPFPLRPRMQALTLEVILRTVIGVQDGDRLAALRRALPPLADIGPLFMMRLMYPKLRQRWP